LRQHVLWPQHGFAKALQPEVAAASRRVPPPQEALERPKAMATKEGGSTALITLERVK